MRFWRTWLPRRTYKQKPHDSTGADGKKALVEHVSKDINSFLYQMQNANLPATVIESVIFRNEKIDRPEKLVF